jgi:ubiquinone biosynthesis protein UbiJ
MFTRTTLAIINHLLSQSGWAQQRLINFKNMTVHFNIPPFSFTYLIEEQGILSEAASDINVDANFIIPPSLIPRLAFKDENALSQIVCSGDTALIDEVFFMARNLRWDAAEDLSHLTGDIAAERIVQFSLAKHQLVRDTALNLSQALAEYWTEERPLLAKPDQLTDFANKVIRLHDDMEQLEHRILQLLKAK